MPTLPEYFALPNPDQPDQMTFWRRPEGCHATPHPHRAHYGPTLLKSDVPKDLRGEAKARWVNGWYQTVAYPWRDRMRAAIDADEATCAARYAVIHERCCCCNRELKDPDSLRVGVGPDCRDGWPASAVELMASKVAELRAAAVAP